MKLHDIKPNPGARHRRRRVGNGESSGLGKTCGKGHKGQKSRAGASVRPNFEGGQMPIFRRLPKKGFNNARFKTKVAIVNVKDLEEKFDDGETVSEETLREKGLVKGRCDAVKILGNGELTKKLTVQAGKVSASALEKIAKAGGSVAEPKEEKPAEKEKKKEAKTAKKSAGEKKETKANDDDGSSAAGEKKEKTKPKAKAKPESEEESE